ncbi:MAG: SDR family NAD(P)-dependent oxidoreductase, partial [bacterium]
MKFENKVVLITGSHHGIGCKTKELFIAEGAIVCGIDKQEGEFFTGDLQDPAVIEAYVEAVVSRYGHIDIIVNNAKPAMAGIHEGCYEAFMEALAVGVG